MVGFFSKNSNGYGFSVLEIGGGVNQVAASQILERFANLNFVEFEKRKIDDKVRRKLEETSHYHLFKKGFFEAIEELGKNACFSIIFAHNVLNHLPNPFFIIEQSWPFLQDGGIFFANGVLIYQEEWKKLLIF
jgi:2-polyprenyl-3-methyl-5-hydroxy-6-metoxy-1,4-benzoquinol methylase